MDSFKAAKDKVCVKFVLLECTVMLGSTKLLSIRILAPQVTIAQKAPKDGTNFHVKSVPTITYLVQLITRGAYLALLDIIAINLVLPHPVGSVGQAFIVMKARQPQKRMCVPKGTTVKAVLGTLYFAQLAHSLL